MYDIYDDNHGVLSSQALFTWKSVKVCHWETLQIIDFESAKITFC